MDFFKSIAAVYDYIDGHVVTLNESIAAGIVESKEYTDEQIAAIPEGLKFVKRDNLAVVDFDYITLTRNGTWQELDLSSIVPVGTSLIKFNVITMLGVYGDYLYWDNGGTTNHAGCYTCYRPGNTNIQYNDEIELVCDANRKVKYNIQDSSLAGSITVRGWWI